MTRYTYDSDGRVTSSQPESEWNEQEQSWILALELYRSWLCPCGCGNLAEESTAIENDENYKVKALRCHARTAVLTAAERFKESPHAEALMFSAERRK